MTEEATEAPTPDLAAEVARLREENTKMRQNVVTVARKYAVAHNLCTVVDQALEEAGLGPQRENFTMEFLIPAKIEVSADVSLMGEMTQEERSKQVAATISQALLLLVDSTRTNNLVRQQVGVGAGIERPQPQPTITLGEITMDGEPLPSPAIPEAAQRKPNWIEFTVSNYAAGYTGPDGRKIHFVRFQNNGVPDHAAICGAWGGAWPTESPRADHVGFRDGICANCRRMDPNYRIVPRRERRDN